MWHQAPNPFQRNEEALPPLLNTNMKLNRFSQKTRLLYNPTVKCAFSFKCLLGYIATPGSAGRRRGSLRGAMLLAVRSMMPPFPSVHTALLAVGLLSVRRWMV